MPCTHGATSTMLVPWSKLRSWWVYFEGGGAGALALVHPIFGAGAGALAKKWCFRASDFESDLNTNKRQALVNSHQAVPRGLRSNVRERAHNLSPQAKPYAWWPILKPQELYNSWQVYFEGGELCALARTRAPQARPGKMVPLCSNACRQICIQTKLPSTWVCTTLYLEGSEPTFIRK